MGVQATQLEAVKGAMGGGSWVTLDELRKHLSDNGIPSTEQGVSARVRDLRKEQFGGHKVERRKAWWSDRVFQYRMAV